MSLQNSYHCYTKDTWRQFQAVVAFAATLDWKSQERLRRLEDRLATLYHVQMVDSESADDRLMHYLDLTSLPFIKMGKDIPDLKTLWEPPPNLKSLVWRPTYGTGNLHPKLMVIGDAPGVGDGELESGKFDRVFVYGPSSHLLRKALIELNGIYYKTWFTNLLKTSTQGNVPSTYTQQVRQRHLLEREIRTLRPSIILLLGNHVNESYRTLFENYPYQKPVRVLKAYHPSFASRQQWSPAEYAAHLGSILRI